MGARLAAGRPRVRAGRPADPSVAPWPRCSTPTPYSPRPGRPLLIGVGGGGDVAATPGARRAAARALHAARPVVGGRELGAPRRRPPCRARGGIGEITGVVEQLAPSAVLARPRHAGDRRVTGAEPMRFAESRAAELDGGEHRPRSIPCGGPPAVAEGLARRRRAPRAPTCSCSSTSAATRSPTATSPASPARSATRSCSPPGAVAGRARGASCSARSSARGATAELTLERGAGAAGRDRRAAGAWPGLAD